MNVYKVSYQAHDGSYRSFTVSSKRRLVNAAQMCYSTNPLLGEVMREIKRRQEDASSPMSKHGGCKRLTKITNVDTGNFELFDISF